MIISLIFGLISIFFLVPVIKLRSKHLFEVDEDIEKKNFHIETAEKEKDFEKDKKVYGNETEKKKEVKYMKDNENETQKGSEVALPPILQLPENGYEMRFICSPRKLFEKGNNNVLISPRKIQSTNNSLPVEFDMEGMKKKNCLIITP